MFTPRSDLPAVGPQSTLRQVIAVIDATARGIALVLDVEARLLGTITDGDIRRAMLAGSDLDAPIGTVLESKQGSVYRVPVTAPVGTAPQQLLCLMARHAVRQVPLLDADRRVCALVTADDLLPNLEAPPQAVVMAGGFGTRLRPLTDNLPKPMLPVGGKPLLEHIVGTLREAGIERLHLTTHFMPESITGHFGDGRRFGVDISYVNEDLPLGTAGALRLLPPWQSPLLVINGDILTRVHFQAMLAFHREHRAAMTVAVRRYEVKVPYGVMDLDGVAIRGLDEKPELHFFVNAGIYLLEPEVHARLPHDGRCDMTDLIGILLAAQRPVISFPLREYWLDIGRLSDYEKANHDYAAACVTPLNAGAAAQ